MSSDEDSLITADSMPSLLGWDEDNRFDVEPHLQADHTRLARDADGRPWTDLVVAEVATYFHGNMAAVLGTWASAVYSRSSLRGVGNNYAADYLSRGMMFAAPGLVRRAEYRPRLMWDHVPHAPAAVAESIHRHGVLAWGDASMNGGGGVIIDLTSMFHRRLIWHTDNLGAYREYVDDVAIEYMDDTAHESSGIGSDSNEESVECVD